MPYLELPDGVPLYYTDEGAGPPVVLIHGWTMNNTFWAGNVPALAASNRVVTVDLRGHGLSGKTDDGHTLAQYARDVRALLGHLQLERASLVGWSMGVAVALAYVQQYGCDTLRSVAFVDQSPRFLDGDGWDFPLFGGYSKTDIAVFVQDLEHARPAVVKPFIASCFATPQAAETIDAAYAETTKTPTSAAVDIWLDMAYADLRPVLSQVTVPALLAYGERSAVFPGNVAGWLADQLPDARIEHFDKSGHVPFVEEADRFNEVLAGFLATV